MTDPNRSKPAARLRKWMERTNTNQSELARILDVRQASVWRWVTEKSEPRRLDLLLSLERVTGIPAHAWRAGKPLRARYGKGA